MTLYRRLGLVALSLLCALWVFGCGVGSTVAENNRTIRRVADYDARMLVDDLGNFAQLNRPFRGSRWILE